MPSFESSWLLYCEALAGDYESPVTGRGLLSCKSKQAKAELHEDLHCKVPEKSDGNPSGKTLTFPEVAGDEDENLVTFEVGT